MRHILAAASVALIAGCSTAQLATVQGYQDKIAGACSVAMMLAPVAGPVAPYILGGCATEAAVAKLALDPDSLAWVSDLAAKVKAKGA